MQCTAIYKWISPYYTKWIFALFIVLIDKMSEQNTHTYSLSCKNGMFDFFFFPKQKHLHFFVSNRTFAVFFHPDRMRSVNGFYFSVQIISAFSWYLFSTSVWYPHKCCRLYNIITYHLSETRKSHKKYLNVKQKIPHTHTNTKSSRIFFELISQANIACALSLQVLQAFLISSPFFPSLDSPQWERFPSHLNQIFEDAHGCFYVSDNFAFNRSSLDTFIYLIVIRL